MGGVIERRKCMRALTCSNCKNKITSHKPHSLPTGNRNRGQSAAGVSCTAAGANWIRILGSGKTFKCTYDEV